jgi:hypothetical protein
MRTLLPLLLLLSVGCAVDRDGDGVVKGDDCDDEDPARFPGNTEVCDGSDNDCNDLVDDEAIDRITSYADVDEDGFGDADNTALECSIPTGFVADNTDCDDADDEINPDAIEICNAGVDDDCDGLADDDDDDLDTSTGTTFWVDADQDGYGDPDRAVMACALPAGATTNAEDCDDESDDSYPGAPELCDGLDNDCDEVADAGLAGVDPICAGVSCAQVLADRGTTANGRYWVDPGGDDPFQAWCDMTTDGGGWALISWTGDSTGLTPQGFSAGTPYPGLVVCEDFLCGRGSGGSAARLQAIINGASELAVGHSTGALTSFQALGSYTYAASFDYGDLSSLELEIGVTSVCDTAGIASGTTRVLAGPTDYAGMTMHLAQGFRYLSSPYDEANTYIWNIGAHVQACGGSGSPPAVYLGNWSTSEHEYGPYVGSTEGARSVWAR